MAVGYVKKSYMERDFGHFDQKFWMPLYSKPDVIQYDYAQGLYVQSKGQRFVVFTQSRDIFHGLRLARCTAYKDGEDFQIALYNTDGDRDIINTNEYGNLLSWPKELFSCDYRGCLDLLKLQSELRKAAKENG